MAGALLGVAAGMVGLAYVSAPLYGLFCRVIGFGGTTLTAAAPTGVGTNSHRALQRRSCGSPCGWTGRYGCTGLVWGVVVLGATVGALRPAKAYAVALQWKRHPETFGE